MALATIRRLLLELGRPAGPESSDHTIGPIELWMRQPRTDLDGLTPLAVLSLSDGVDRVRHSLTAMIEFAAQHGLDGEHAASASAPAATAAPPRPLV